MVPTANLLRVARRQYEKLVGHAFGEVDPSDLRNAVIADIGLAPRNASGEVEVSADFYLIKPLDPRKGNGVLFYEVGNRGTMAMLPSFQKAARATRFRWMPKKRACDGAMG